MSDIELKRTIVQNLYEGEAWRQRVKTMSDSQIVAIYMKYYKTSKTKEAMSNMKKDNPPF
jgi:hypothetical protein